MPQFWCWVSAGQAAPPNLGRLSALRERVEKPPPQLAVQGLQSPYLPTAQLRAQGTTRHCARCFSAGHIEPPFCGPRFNTVRVRSRVPPPHEREQLLKAPHKETVQRTGQRPALQ